MAGTVGGPESTSTPSPLTDQTRVQNQSGIKDGQKVQQTNVPNQLNALSPDQTPQTPIEDRSSTPVDNATSTPGLSKPSEEKDLPALEKDREDMLKEAGELMQKNEELTVLGFALRSLQPQNYDQKLTPPPGLKVTLQMNPDAPVYTVEPPDENFKQLPKDQQVDMKKMAYNLLMKHATTSPKYANYDLKASREQIEKLKEQLEKNGEEIGKKNGDNNWRERLKTLEHRPAHIVISDDKTGPKVTATDDKETPGNPKPAVNLNVENEPEISSTGSEDGLDTATNPGPPLSLDAEEDE